MPQLKVLDASGDTVIEWQSDDPVSFHRARRAFCQLHAEKRLAFALAPGERTGEHISTFDEAGERDIVMVRPGQGG